MSVPTPEQAAQLEVLARQLAWETGRLIVADRPDALRVSTKSSRSDVVTHMDAAAEAHLRRRLRELRPDDSVFGEEGDTVAGTSEITWVLDPIDGTVNYLYGIGDYAVSVAAVLGDPDADGGWSPVAGAVAHPEAGIVYSASRGGGAWAHRMRRDEAGGATDEPQGEAVRLATTGAEDLDLSLLGTGFGYLAQVRRRQAEILTRILPDVRDIRRGGSAALDLCAVAAGRLDAYYERGVNPWDYAGGWLIVTEAGGVVTGVVADHPGADGVVAATAGVHEPVRSLVREATQWYEARHADDPPAP